MNTTDNKAKEVKQIVQLNQKERLNFPKANRQMIN